MDSEQSLQRQRARSPSFLQTTTPYLMVFTFLPMSTALQKRPGTGDGVAIEAGAVMPVSIRAVIVAIKMRFKATSNKNRD